MATRVVVQSKVTIRGSTHEIVVEGVDATRLAKEVKEAIAELENATVSKEQEVSH